MFLAYIGVTYIIILASLVISYGLLTCTYLYVSYDVIIGKKYFKLDRDIYMLLLVIIISTGGSLLFFSLPVMRILFTLISILLITLSISELRNNYLTSKLFELNRI